MKRGSYEEAQAEGHPHRGLIFCKTCGGSYTEVGVSGGRDIPHADACPRKPKDWRIPYPPAEQDRERAALAHLGSPLPTHDIDCPCGCADRYKERGEWF